MSELEKVQKLAYSQGKQAYLNGEDYDSNPYTYTNDASMETERYLKWQEGYCDDAEGETVK